ncbi:hypothetical protein [Crenothrix polyspora]|uniref:Porin n=1 Tax=Crenothrix polyspora TaxID=360316 RepID=A0A1R4HDD5_9GAMM|nr:hypothetical protein [Crenothrix polyspora]SJM93890.1 conserved exported hypothetical protein [Crenothrix polyspora]
MRHALNVLVIALMSVVASPVALATEAKTAYQLGHGYRLGKTGIQLGGYVSSKLSGFSPRPWKFDVSDLSLFVSWSNGAKLNFFSELELEESISGGQEHGLSTRNAHVALERLYFDYLVNDLLAVRVGKFLTPVGQWNQIHADPLVWTTTRPVATENLFSKHATGIMLHGNIPFGEQSLDYTIYGDYSTVLDPLYETGRHENFDNALGVRLRYNVDEDLQIGLSYVDFNLLSIRGAPDIRHHLLGVDLAWTYQRLAVTSEIVYRNNNSAGNAANAWQGYIQGVGSLSKHFYAVGRYEFFEQTSNKLGQVGVLGMAYHPSPPLIWKLEYRYGVNNKDFAPDGLFASFSVLF